MILCEQCGNEFNKGTKIERGKKTYIKCPYCGYYNTPPWENKKRKKKKSDVRPQKEQSI